MEPSAFIPFCEFGGNMSAMSINREPFKVPICNSFRDKILNDKLCYEVDINKKFDQKIIKEGLKVGLTFLLDHNEDRQVQFEEDKVVESKSDFFFNNLFYDYVNDESNSLIYVDTIGRKHILFGCLAYFQYNES